MAKAASARRYAQAVFLIASEKGSLDEWSGDLQALAGVLDDEELARMLDAPQVPASRKLDAVRAALEGTVGPLALNLVSLLATRNLVRLVPDVVDEYSRLLDAARGIERAEVLSAVHLDERRKSEIADMLSRIVGKQVELISVVEQGILGGFSARVGDRVIDGSMRSKLEGMRRSVVEQAG